MTAGGTREPIDGVRVLANASTGETGRAIADAFFQEGCAVTLLRADSTVHDLDAACFRLLSTEHFDLMIHAAAVSDFVVESVTVGGVRHATPLTGKLPSSSKLTLELVPGKKILPELKGYSRNPSLRLVGFKLTDGASEAEIREAVGNVLAAGADRVVHNDQQTMAKTRAVLWDVNGPGAPLPDLAALCDALVGYAKTL